jgi:group I intron endonuclease
MDEKKYVVYKHTSPSGKVYIGITRRKPEARWKDGRGYSRHTRFAGAIRKYGWENFTHEILAENLTASEAKAMEMELIRLYRSTEKQFGYNATRGGDGCLGCNPSDESRQKMSANHYDASGANNPMFGRNHTPEARLKMSETKKRLFAERAAARPKKNRISEAERKARLSERMKGANNPSYGKGFSVIQISASGEIIKIYQTAREAERETGVDHTTISRCCKNKQKTAGGFCWKYKEADTRCSTQNK